MKRIRENRRVRAFFVYCVIGLIGVMLYIFHPLHPDIGALAVEILGTAVGFFSLYWLWDAERDNEAALMTQSLREMKDLLHKQTIELSALRQRLPLSPTKQRRSLWRPLLVFLGLMTIIWGIGQRSRGK